ncbi:hypothetical protein [Faecalibaculum rodentium]|nr:hypothetical protein [Faecalibaculum rodentium]
MYFQILPSGTTKKKISYYKLLSPDAFPLCTAALRTVLPRINLKEIGEMIDEIPVLSPLQKEFCKYMLQARKERILDKALDVIESR